MKRNHLNKAILTVVMTMIFIPIFAQTNDPQTANESGKITTSIKYCANYEDFQSNHWKQVDSVLVITKSRNKQMWWGGKDFKFDSDNKDIKNLLKKEAFAINYHDTLLINTHPYKDRGTTFGNGYARIFNIKDGKLLMTYYNVSEMSKNAMIGGMFGLVGSLAMSATNSKIAKQNVCYIITPGDKKAVIIDAKVMEELLKDHQTLLDEYLAVKKSERLNEEVVLPLLKKAELL